MLIAILVAGIIFYEAFVALKALSNVAAMRDVMTGSLAVVQSPTMSDEDKAVALRKSGLAMFSSVAQTALKIAAAGAAAVAFLFALSLAAWPFEALLEYSVKPLPLLATLVALTIYGLIRHGRRR